MKKPVTVKLLAMSAAGQVQFARRLGDRVSTSNLPSGYQIKDGYILKAQRNLKGYTVIVMDTPMYLMLSGSTKTNTTTPNPSTPVGARDGFLPADPPEPGEPPALTPTYTAFENQANYYVPPAQPKDPVGAVSADLIWAPVQWRKGVFGLGTKRYPYKVGGGFNIVYDNAERFPYSQTMTITAKMATFPGCALPTGTINQLRNTYLGLAHFNVSEDDLPPGWSHHPRRLVAGEVYTNVGDPYRGDRSGEVVFQFGVAWSPAGEMEEGADYFCITSEIYRQLRNTWLKGDDSQTYRPPYYDQEGEHALAVFIGRLQRDAYDPDNAVPLYAEMVEQYMVTAAELPVVDLQPYPEDYSFWNGGPSRPNFGIFFDPMVFRTTNGFTAFSYYRHDRLNQPNLRVRAMVVVTPDHTPHVLKADAWPNNQAFTYPDNVEYRLDLPGYEESVRCNPWLVGGFTVEGINGSGTDVTHTAYALVYEHDDANDAEVWVDTPIFGQQIGTNYGQSKWALYTVESGPPTRTELTQITPSASVVATLLTSRFSWPNSQSSDTNNIWAPFSHLLAKEQRLCNFADAGNGLGVTASIDRPHYMTPYSGGWGGESDLTPHDVKCAVVNLVDGTIEQRGTIFVRDKMYTWCFITVAQPYDPGDPDKGIPERQPVLVASTVDTVNTFPPTGKCWLSRDGGWTWSEYVTDVGAHMGAHLVGNKLFQYDPLKPFL